MYKCLNCGETFSSPDSVRDFESEYFGRTVTHYMNVCPSCGSDDFEEMDKCEICGEYIDAGSCLCENCKELIGDLASEIRGKVREKAIVHKLNYDEFIRYLEEEI